MELPYTVLKLFVTVLVMTIAVRASVHKTSRPNVVLIVADDLGYGDVGCFGNTTLRTPHLDKLARQGVKLTHSVAAASVCTPSRAAFLTGRYSIRSGKWHLGWSLDRSDPDHPHPLNQGFDYFYGLPLTNLPDYSNFYKPILTNIFPSLPSQLILTFLLVLISVIILVLLGYLRLHWGVLMVFVIGLSCGTVLFTYYRMKLLNSFMYRNYDMVEQPIHLPSVTRKLVKESEDFLLACHADRAPFLLIVSWLHVHTALATAPEFRGQSQHGPYGDAVEEMDWGVGQLMEMLDRFGMADNTLVYFTSDHGALPQARDLMGRVTGGFNGPFSGGKGDGSTEGSYRVPALIRWPGQFPAGRVVTEPVSMMDVLPTLAEVILPPQHPDVTAGHVIDGKSLVALLKGEVTVSPHEFLFHYCQDSVHAVTYRSSAGGKIWKLTFREPDPNTKPFALRCEKAFHLNPPKLFELSSDPTASVPLSGADHVQVVSAIVEAVRQHQASVQEVPSQFTWWRLMWQPWKQPCCNFPLCACEDDKFKGLFKD